MKRCTNCGELISENVNFCPHCGELLVDLDGETLDVDVAGNHSSEHDTIIDKEETIDHEGEKQVSAAWENVKASVSGSVNVENILSYLAGYGQFFARTLLSPTVAFEGDYYIGGIVNLIIFAILLMFASNAGFLLNLLAVPLFVAVLYGVTYFILNNKMSIYRVIADFGGQLSLSNFLLLLISLFGRNQAVGSYLLLIFVTSFLVALSLYIFKVRKDNKIEQYYQLLAAYFVLLFAIALFWSQGMF